MRRIIPFFLVMLMLSGCGAAASSSGKSGYRQITAKQAAELMETETDYIILDVRTQEEYEDRHIPDAVCIPNETIGSAETAASRPPKSWSPSDTPMSWSSAESTAGPEKPFPALRDEITEKRKTIWYSIIRKKTKGGQNNVCYYDQ